MHMSVKAALAGVASIGAVATFAVPAHASSTIDQINKGATRSASHRIVYVNATVSCSEDTTSAALSVTVSQVTSGGLQIATGTVASLGAFECSGEEEVVQVPVRRPTGGFAWVKGSARASNLVFITDDPNPGINIDVAKGRTINVK